MRACPPMKSKYTGCTEKQHQKMIKKQLDRNEKARLRMARRRAELKNRSASEQAAASARQRGYQARYRANKRETIRQSQRERRLAAYEAVHGRAALQIYCNSRLVARTRSQSRQNSQDGYDSNLENYEDSEETDELCSSDEDDR
ncbi:hypothetical protein R3P38DRAFT_2791504 [Favolaschia claudopus]|uniref:Uncharacterized protein n=1 Tax=Favolaschia claudopus TaxID=2862362 RepID=A0AAW0AHB3_9AGAR